MLARRPFFLYGTLLPDQPNHHLWEGAASSVEPATFEGGRLYDMGYYPMLVEGAAGVVKGVVLEVVFSQYETILARFDSLEGFDPTKPRASIYRRYVRSVVPCSGKRIEAWVYLGKPECADEAMLIASGDWLLHSTSTRDSIHAWWGKTGPRLPPDRR